MKRLIAGFLSVCVAVSLLMTGCSSGGTGNASQTDGPVTITIWHDKEDEVAQALQAELDTLAPDIVVKLEKKDGLTDSLKMVGNDPKSAPDMYFFAHDKIGVWTVSLSAMGEPEQFPALVTLSRTSCSSGQLARCRSAEDAVLCPSDMMLCVISYWVLSGAKWRQIQQLRCCALSRQAVEMKEAPAKPYTKIRKK